MKDIEELNLNVTFEDIKKMSKGHWTNIIKESIKDNVFQKLVQKKDTHSKVKGLKYESLPNKMECSNEDVQLIFKMRSNMTKKIAQNS